MGESRQQKEWTRIAQHPNTVRFQDVVRLLTLSGWTLDRVRGSHHVFRKGADKLVVPFRKPHILSIYVKQVLDQTKEDDNGGS